jgi:hypothetical protein
MRKYCIKYHEFRYYNKVENLIIGIDNIMSIKEESSSYITSKENWDIYLRHKSSDTVSPCLYSARSHVYLHGNVDHFGFKL